MGRYEDRRHAGRVLAEALREYAGRPDMVVLALPHEEFATGAIASGGVIVLDRAVIQGLGIPLSAVEAAIAREQAELARREQLYRGGRPPLDVTGKTSILEAAEREQAAREHGGSPALGPPGA